MKLGLFNMGSGVADPNELRNIAQAADAAGLESLWCGEHVVLPKPREAPSPADPDHAFLHPSAVLSFLAAVTERVKLGTGIVLIAQRNPVVLAKEFASVDVLSAGARFLASGRATCSRSSRRSARRSASAAGARTRRSTRCGRSGTRPTRVSWGSSGASAGSTRTRVRSLQAACQSTLGVTRKRRSDGRRSAGKGWYGWMQDPEQTATAVRRLGELSDEVERAEHLGPLEITITPPARLTSEAVEQYAEAGAHRLVSLAAPNERSMLHAVEHLAGF